MISLNNYKAYSLKIYFNKLLQLINVVPFNKHFGISVIFMIIPSKKSTRKYQEYWINNIILIFLDLFLFLSSIIEQLTYCKGKNLKYTYNEWTNKYINK